MEKLVDEALIEVEGTLIEHDKWKTVAEVSVAVDVANKTWKLINM